MPPNEAYAANYAVTVAEAGPQADTPLAVQDHQPMVRFGSKADIMR